jgi:hypothetical protein
MHLIETVHFLLFIFKFYLKDSESTHTQTTSETSYSEGSGAEEGSSGVDAAPTLSEDEDEHKKSGDGEDGGDEAVNDKNEMKEEETKTTTSNDKTSTMLEDGSETSSGDEH